MLGKFQREDDDSVVNDIGTMKGEEKKNIQGRPMKLEPTYKKKTRENIKLNK